MKSKSLVLVLVLAESLVTATGCVVNVLTAPDRSPLGGAAGAPAPSTPPVATPTDPAPARPLAPASSPVGPISGALPGAGPAARPRIDIGFPVIQYPQGTTNLVKLPVEYVAHDAVREVHVDILLDRRRTRGIDLVRPGGNIGDFGFRVEPVSGVSGVDTRLVLDLFLKEPLTGSGQLVELVVLPAPPGEAITFTARAPLEPARNVATLDVRDGGLQPSTTATTTSRVRTSFEGVIP